MMSIFQTRIRHLRVIRSPRGHSRTLVVIASSRAVAEFNSIVRQFEGSRQQTGCSSDSGNKKKIL